tara:strand:- start:6724 stop:7653 length:930 start_codon:yes stop_codon:yes gene_type:complete
MKKTFLTLLSILSITFAGCTSDNILTHEKEVVVETYPDVWVDSFIQPSQTEGYDILWVIDRSGSMNNHDPELLAGIEAMLTSLPLDTGWRLGIISTDEDEALSNTTFPLVPGDDITEATAALNALSSSSYYGPAGEAGFESVYAYMELGAYSTSWMRQSAALLIVFVSDEDEQSWEWSPTEFYDWITTKRSRVLISSIVGLNESTCADEVGQGYLDVTGMANGVEIDICSSDWTPGVAEASKPFEPIEYIELSQYPLESSIRVLYDSVEQDISIWDYDVATNTVYFTPIPSDGVLVEVVYSIDSTADSG